MIIIAICFTIAAYVIGVIVGMVIKFPNGAFIITDSEDLDGLVCGIKMYDSTDKIVKKKYIVLDVVKK